MHCSICQNKTGDFQRTHGNVFSCKRCSGRFIWPQLSSAELVSLYSEDYFSNVESARAGYASYLDDKPLIIKTFEKRLNRIEQYTSNHGTLLDLGCAMGFFLDAASRRGWDVRGLDISQFAAQETRKRFGKERISCGILEHAQYSRDSFELITGWDYIEHVQNPDSIIKISSTLLKPEGLLVLSTPQVNSMPARFFGKKWMGYKNDHLFYFTRSAIVQLLEKHGFSIQHTSFIGKYVMSEWFLHRLKVYSPVLATTLKRSLNIFGISNFPMYINPFDIMMVIAQKKK